MHRAVERATKHGEGEDGDGKEDEAEDSEEDEAEDGKEDEAEEARQSGGDDEVSGSDGEDASQRMSIIQITAIPHNPH